MDEPQAEPNLCAFQDQANIHRRERDGLHEIAAQLLIDCRFFHVNRSAGLLARLPANRTGAQALKEAIRDCSGGPLPQPVHPKLARQIERSAGLHYLTHHAPAEDKIYVQPPTFDAYRQLGGGMYLAKGDKHSRPPAQDCVICGDEMAWLGLGLCEFCYQVTRRMPAFLAKGGKDYLFRLLGKKLGLHEIAMILQGQEQQDGQRSAARRDETEVDTSEGEGTGD